MSVTAAVLADALAQEKIFPKFYVGMVRAGELGGALEPALRKLADYLARTQAIRDTIASALVYPAILLVTSGFSISDHPAVSCFRNSNRCSRRRAQNCPGRAAW